MPVMSEEKKDILYCPSCKKKTEAEVTPLISGDSLDSLWHDYGHPRHDLHMLLGRSCLNCKTRVYVESEKSAIKHYFFGPKPIGFVRQIVWFVILWLCFYKLATNSELEDFLFFNLHISIFLIIYFPISIGLIFLPFGFLGHLISELKEYNYLKRLLIERRATLKERQRHKPINPSSH